MNPILKNLDVFIESLKKEDPALYAQCVPRRYLPPNGYINPKFYAGSLLCIERRKHANGISDSLDLVGRKLLEYKVPTYFVGEDFCRAVAATEPPDGMKMSELHFPMEAMVLCWPQKFILEYLSGSGVKVAGFSSIARLQRRDLEAVHATANNMDIDRIVLHHPIHWGELPVDYTRIAQLGDELVKKAIDNCTFVTFDGTGRILTEAPQDRTIEERVAQMMNALATKVLLALGARPELREEGMIARPASNRCHKELEELWHPNLIGRQYRIVRPPGYVPSSSHLSPRMHWRRGHMRRQHFGRLGGQIKTIWIDPVLVCADAEEKDLSATTS